MILLTEVEHVSDNQSRFAFTRSVIMKRRWDA